MLTFKVHGKKSSPGVFIDKQNHIIEISGSSTIKDASFFYSNVLKWAIAFTMDSSQTTTINLKLDRMNEGSTKWIMLIVRKLSAVVPGKKVMVNWYYQPSNSNMLLNGERLKLNALVPVNLIAA